MNSQFCHEYLNPISLDTSGNRTYAPTPNWGMGAPLSTKGNHYENDTNSSACH